MDNFFSSPDLYDDLIQKKIYCCGTVRLNRRGMPKDLKHKTLRLKWGDIRVRTRGDLTAVVWRDKRDVGILTNIHDPPSEGNFRDEHGSAIKPAIVADYNRHMGYVDKGDRMANSYTASRRTWKWSQCQNVVPAVFNDIRCLGQSLTLHCHAEMSVSSVLVDRCEF